MILSLAVVLGLLASLARHRGHIVEAISAMSLRSAWLALLALFLQVPLLRAPFGTRQEVVFQQVLFLLSHLLLLAFIWRNRHSPGIRLLGVGVVCNLVVIVANGGWMPISPETLLRINPATDPGQWPAGYHYGYSKDVILAVADTRLWWLSDTLVVPPPFPWPTAFSVGDLFVAAGIFLVLWQAGNPDRAERKEMNDETQKSQSTALCRHGE